MYGRHARERHVACQLKKAFGSATRVVRSETGLASRACGGECAGDRTVGGHLKTPRRLRARVLAYPSSPSTRGRPSQTRTPPVVGSTFVPVQQHLLTPQSLFVDRRRRPEDSRGSPSLQLRVCVRQAHIVEAACGSGLRRVR